MTSLMKWCVSSFVLSFFACGFLAAYSDYPGCVAPASFFDISFMFGASALISFFACILAVLEGEAVK